METKLKPCPFCGSDNIQLESWPEKTLEYAQICTNCGCIGPTDLGISGAEEMWNLRRPAADLLEVLESVEFVHFSYNDVVGYRCPWCKCDMAHFHDCPRQAAIRKARGEKHE